MGDILPFVAKVRSSGDWTPGERARLEELADRFAGVADGVEVVFGTTDEGDPWCVVKDVQDEILVHVARIGGKFVIHYALDDALTEGADLPALLAERLQWEEDDDERDSVVVPFSRQAQSLLALIIATAFFYETARLERGDDVQTGSVPHDPALDEAAQLALAPEALDLGSQFAAKTAAAVAVGASIAWPSRSFAAASVDDPAPVAGPAGGWSPGGPRAPEGVSAENPALLPAAGVGEAPRPFAVAMADFQPHALTTWTSGVGHTDPQGPTITQDPTGGEPPGVEGLTGGSARQMLNEGGDGADRLELGPRTVAAGGGGGDEFVARKQEDAGAGSQMGVIADFRPEEGDRLVNAFGMKVHVLAENATTTTLTAVPGVLLAGNAHGSGPMLVNGRQVEVDVDFDGKVDGYVVLVNYNGRSLLTAKADEPPHAAIHPAAEGNLSLAGHSLEHYEL